MITKLNKFIENENTINEGIKSNIIGGILTLMTLLPNTSLAKSYEKTITKTVSSEADMNRLIRKGWDLNSVEIDTIYNKVRNIKPDTVIHNMSIKLDNELFFESGGFTLSDDQKSLINTMLENLIVDDAIILNAHIVSSTDKQGLSVNLKKQLESKGVSGDNKGLSQLRSKSLADYITSKGINSDLVSTNALCDMGEGEVSNEDRYVYLEVQYLKIEEIEIEELIGTEKKSYNMAKTFMYNPNKRKVKNKRIRRGLLGKVNSYKSRGAIKCSFGS